MGWQKLKVYSPTREYIASCSYLDDAAKIVLYRGAGACVKLGYSKWETIYTLPIELAPTGSFQSIILEMETGMDRVRTERDRRNKEHLRRREIEDKELRKKRPDSSETEAAYQRGLEMSGWGAGAR